MSIMLVDDHTLVREGLRVLIELQDDMIIAGEAATGKEAIALFSTLQPDLLLLDLMLPDMCGIDVITKIRSEYPEAVVLVLTTFHGEEDIYLALKSGAKGYLLKDTPKEQLFEAIRRISEGQHYIPGEIATKLALYVKESSLTPREMEILSLISMGYPNKKIADQLHVTVGTVKTHINHILSKLSVGSRTEAIRVAQERGLLRSHR